MNLYNLISRGEKSDFRRSSVFVFPRNIPNWIADNDADRFDLRAKMADDRNQSILNHFRRNFHVALPFAALTQEVLFHYSAIEKKKKKMRNY